jgi:vancomycin permeability regulator SanA
MKVIKAFLIIITAVCCIFVTAVATVFGIDLFVKKSTEKYILTPEEAGEGYDCILVLGCGVYGDTPSHMLEDRLLQGIELYENGASDKMLMSGDHGRENYDEVNVMKDFAVDRGVKSRDIFMDHAGFSTYESMYRAKEVFKAEKIIIVTQDYHLYRAVYDARALGLEAYGVASNPRTYSGQLYRDLREILARNKDFIFGILKPEPTYLGEPIPVNGNGDVTNDK